MDTATKKQDYFNWLSRSDIVISTAVQENFGISVVEAVRYGCFPLLPDRLSYPELIPEKYHSTSIYKDEKDLSKKLTDVLLNCHEKNIRNTISNLTGVFAGFSWQLVCEKFDVFFSEQKHK